MRGEYLDIILPGWRDVELPPRARRIHYVAAPSPQPNGTTSACAENTIEAVQKLVDDRNYLRVRGEYHHPHENSPHGKELPPRARRIR